jgi:hypothetical protein
VTYIGFAESGSNINIIEDQGFERKGMIRNTRERE